MIDREEAHAVVRSDPHEEGVTGIGILSYHDISAKSAIVPLYRAGLQVWESVEGHWRSVVSVHDDDAVIRAEVKSSRHEESSGTLRQDVQTQHPDARRSLERAHPVPLWPSETSSTHNGILSPHD